MTSVIGRLRPPGASNPGSSAFAASKAAAPLGAPAQDALELGRRNIQETFALQTRDRGTPAYVKALASLPSVLSELADKPGAHWMDSGAGYAGWAARGFLEYGPSAFQAPEFKNGATIEPVKLPPKTLTVTLLDLDCQVASSDRVKVLSGRFVEQISPAELPKCDLITDVEGPFSYSVRPDLVLARYVEALKDDGRLLLGLGSTVNLSMPGRDSRIIGADGEVRTYVEWLQSIKGIEVIPHQVTSADPDDHWQSLSVEVRRVPGAQVEIPALATYSFQGGGPPRMTLIEQAGSLSTKPETCAAIEAASRQALAVAGAKLSAGEVLDLFRSGPFDNPVHAALSQGGSWRHVGALAAEVAAEFGHGKLEASVRYPVASRLSALVSGSSAPLSFGAVGSVSELSGAKDLTLITDQGELAASARPDLVLRAYLDAIANDGEILVAFGSNGAGTGARSRIMTRKSEDASLPEWLAAIPGLKVDISVRRGHSFAEDHPIARIRIKDRAAISIRTLEPLGALPAAGGPRPILFREDLAEPAPQPTLGDKMNGWALRAWKAMW